jgi:hypothetical protein
MAKEALRGIKGIEAIAYKVDATAPSGYSLDTTKKLYLPYVQEASYQMDIQQGAKTPLTGSGITLFNMVDPDQLLGVNITMANSLWSFEAFQFLCGGTVRNATPGDALTAVVGYSGPLNPQDIPHIQLAFYVERVIGDSVTNGFYKFTFPWARCGYPSAPAFTEKDFIRSELAAYGSKNPNYDSGVVGSLPGPVDVDFIAALPAGFAAAAA